MHIGYTWKVVFTLFGAVSVTGLPDISSETLGMKWHTRDVITRDIAIIGGGASGTYAAIRLGDLNQSVILVERKDRLGGHTETYTDPATGINIELGVLEYHNISLVTNFFARFNIPLTSASESSPPGLIQDVVDFRTGKIVTGYTPSDPTAALGIYTSQVAQYPYLETGFDLPDPVPADLFLPFGDFITKYNISAAANLIFEFNQGAGDFLQVPTIYIMKLLTLSVLQGIQTGFLTTANHDNSQLYEKAEAVLAAANALLLSSHVIACERDNTGVKIAVLTPSGPKLILAKKVLVTMPPTLYNMQPFELDNTELGIFRQFSASGYYTGLIRNSGIPDNVDFQNIGSNTPFNLPALPGLYSIDPTGVPGLHQFLYGSPTVLTNEQVQNNVLASVKQLRSAGTLNTTTPEFVVFSSHSPFLMTVPSEAIKNGFYRNLTGLQGHRSTYYTGATFHTHDSSLLWQFTEALLPKLAA